MNISSESPIECTYSYPIEKDSVVSKLICQIDDKVIEAKVREKEEAKNIYNDAIAAGNSAVFAERKDNKNEEIICLVIGNLLPGQTAIIDLQMIILLQVEGSSYDFNLVTAFLPNYKSHEKLSGA